MKSRHMSAMHIVTHRRFSRVLPWLGALLLFCAASAASAQDDTDPPGRVAHLTHRQGSVVFAPDGEKEWVELPANRPLTGGDRVWSDRGSRAELQLGAATLHLDGESHLGVNQLDDRAAQFILQQGSVNARVREIAQGENFEIGTPNLAFRALQPGDYRIDVDPQTQLTHVTVQSGLAAIFGETGQSIQLGAGQVATFAGRSLTPVQGPSYRQDDFARWVAERHELEEQSVTARYVPRGVVGYAQLDQHGSWTQDPSYGAVWYPRVVVQDWAPYRYGHWEWIGPWGWTWIDDAPWGFAPFHYGRWTMIGTRWAWVPGRLHARPVYSPALVVFLGGGGAQFTVGSGPAVGWYPLAPGEAWWPVYRTSPRYVNYANVNINLGAYPRHYSNHLWRTRPIAITAVRDDDFRRGRPVHRHWRPLQPGVITHAQVGVVPVRPEGRSWRRDSQDAPRLHSAPPATVQPAVPQQRFYGRQLPPAVREQFGAQREQDRLQRDAERTAREQMRQQEQLRRQQDAGWQREQVYRQQQEARIQHERAQQERAHQERAHQERAHQERAQRERWSERARQPQAVQPVLQQPQFQHQPQPRPQQQAPLVRDGQRERGQEGRGGGGGRWQRDGDDGRGRGQGRGPRD